MLDVRDLTTNDPSRIRCRRCGCDHSWLTITARFCPTCGVKLPKNWAEKPNAISSSTPGVVRGYANAMFRLGSHHEVRHNEDEAVRCFGKSSRLGNEQAKVKLLDASVADAFDLKTSDPFDG